MGVLDLNHNKKTQTPVIPTPLYTVKPLTLLGNANKLPDINSNCEAKLPRKLRSKGAQRPVRVCEFPRVKRNRLRGEGLVEELIKGMDFDFEHITEKQRQVIKSVIGKPEDNDNGDDDELDSYPEDVYELKAGVEIEENVKSSKPKESKETTKKKIYKNIICNDKEKQKDFHQDTDEADFHSKIKSTTAKLAEFLKIFDAPFNIEEKIVQQFPSQSRVFPSPSVSPPVKSGKDVGFIHDVETIMTTWKPSVLSTEKGLRLHIVEDTFTPFALLDYIKNEGGLKIEPEKQIFKEKNKDVVVDEKKGSFQLQKLRKRMNYGAWYVDPDIWPELSKKREEGKKIYSNREQH